MKKSPPLSLFVLLPWSFAACGFLITLGNLIGLPKASVPIVPAVDNITGLAASSLFLFGCGLLANLLRPFLKPRS